MKVSNAACEMRKAEEEDLQNRYRIFETSEYLDCLSRISTSDRHFVESKTKNYIFTQLRGEPHFGTNIKKLKGYYPEVWRYRLGHFRLFYDIDENEKVVNILTVEHRKEAYR